ncbi:MAG: O-antigen ligase family protein [Nitrospira sp.]
MPIEMSHARLSGVSRGYQREGADGRGSFYLVLAYLLVDFGRPQDLIPGLNMLALGAVVTVFLGISLARSGRLEFLDKQTVLFMGLLVLMLIHIPLARNTFYSFNTAKLMFFTFISYMSIITFVNSAQKVFVMMRFWIFVHLALAIVGIFKGGVGVGGWVEDENDLCMELNVALAFSAFMAFSATSMKSKLLYLGLSGIFVLTIMATLSRGGFIGLVAVGGYCWLRSSKKFVSAVVVCVLVLVMSVFAPEKYWSEVQSITSEEETQTGTGGERLYTWGIGWEMFLANPIIGIGQGNFPWEFLHYEAGRTFRGHSLSGRLAHSLYLTLLPELGLIGGGIFVAMTCYILLNCAAIHRAYKRSAGGEGVSRLRDATLVALGIEGALLGYLITSVFISTLYYPTFWTLMAFSLVIRKVFINSSDNLEGDSTGLSKAEFASARRRLFGASGPRAAPLRRSSPPGRL